MPIQQFPTDHPDLTISNLSVAFERDAAGDWAWILDNVSLRVGYNEFVSVVGPSGCGKTTLLNVVAGFIKPWNGSVKIGERNVVSPAPDRGVVFQNAALFPWLTAFQNIEYGLRIQGIAKSERRRRVDELIDLVHLRGAEGKLPKELSGGMQQRVGLARALAIEPQILLMDEPFGALDAQTREMLQSELVGIWSAEKKTVLFITHDLQEALLLSERVVVMRARPGQITNDVPVHLPRPRRRTTPEFAQNLARLEDHLKATQTPTVRKSPI